MSARNFRTLTVAQVCERTGFDAEMVRTLVHSGQLAAIQRGFRGRIYILESSLEAFFDRAEDAQRSRSQSPPDRAAGGDDVDASILPDGPRHFA